MSECEICGKEVPIPIKAKIEESILNVCDKCVHFGEKIDLPQRAAKNIKLLAKVELNEIILLENYGNIIKNTREKMKLSRTEFAQKIMEKENIIRRIEMSDLKPDNKLLDKIEIFLNINLKEKNEQKLQKKDTKKAELTMGDVVEVK
ncbi:MAG: TIGR00270 family protein [Candidatus Aenigmarchaeota archaeon]|nr:TIGR00270 family protein [Candidatus Aenigmarchaeota archaeon]